MRRFVQINLLCLGLWLAVFHAGTALASDHSSLHGVRPFSSDHQLSNPFDEERVNGKPFEFTQAYCRIPFIPGSGFGFQVRYTRWKPPAEQANGKVIIYNHGLQSHRGWFNGTAEDFYEQGYTVYAFDRIGCGESTVIEGFLFEGLLSDDDPLTAPVARGDLRSLVFLQHSVRRMIEIAADENPGHEIWLWANSYGAKIITRYLLKHGTSCVAGAVFTTPGNFRNAATLPLPFGIDALLGAPLTDRFDIPMTEKDGDNGAHWFTDDPYWMDKIAGDELSTRYVTTRFYLKTMALDLLNQFPEDPTRLKETPTFYAMVEGDIMMDNTQMVSWIRKYDEKYLIKFYRGGETHKHFLTFTEDREEVITDIMNYISGRTTCIQGATR